MRKAKLFIINTFLLTLTSILMQSISIYFNSFISKKIGTEGIGTFTLILSVYSFFITLSCSGINLTVTKIISKEFAKKYISDGLKIISECLLISFTFGILSSTVLIICSDFILNTFLENRINKKVIYILSVSLPFISMSSAINGYFSATRKIIKTATCQIINQIITLILSVIFLRNNLKKGIQYACFSLILSTCISEILTFIILYFLYKIERFNYKLGNSKTSHKKEIFKICIPVAITSYIRSGLNSIKQLMIPKRLEMSGLKSNIAISKYGIISGMVMPLIYFPGVFVNSLASLLIPEFSSIAATKNQKRINYYTKKILKLSFIMSVCIFGIFITYGDDIILKVYNNYEAKNIFLCLAPLTLIMYVDNIVDGMLRGLDEQVNVMKCNILDLIISIAFIYIAIPFLSIKGYIISFYISEIINGCISIFLLLRKTKIKFNFFNWLIFPLGIAFLSRYILFFIYSILNISSLIIKIVLYVIIFISLSMLTKNITKDDLKL